MCQFESNDAARFHLLTKVVQHYVSDAPRTIYRRWELEKAEQLAKTEAEAEETLATSCCDRTIIEGKPRLK